MPSKVSVNNLTVVHAGSDGLVTAFPDVCLTPAPPAPPIPIPYPNIAKSSDTSQGTSTIVVEGNPIMIQESTFATSTGDEAGSAGGVASATTKGKAKFVNYSFDVKMDGKCVARLGDLMTCNELSSPNTPPMPEVQAPCPVVPPTLPGEEPNEITEVAIQNRPGSGAQESDGADQDAGVGEFVLRFEVDDPNAWAGTKFHLESSDGSFSQQLSIEDDKDPDRGVVELKFTSVPRDKTFSLSVEEPNQPKRAFFSDQPFDWLGYASWDQDLSDL
jgi:hypothetical protein